MEVRVSRVCRTALAALVVAVLPFAFQTGPASAAAGLSRIGPNQAFVGLVNGKHNHATIEVICPGPTRTGHPLRGQTLDVHGGVDDLPGFTGSRANEIVATLPTTSVTFSVVFTHYDMPAPIPVSLVLPCGGKSQVIFSPVPTSRTAIADHVAVTFFSPAMGLGRA
jgi:hypothetical protein